MPTAHRLPQTVHFSKNAANVFFHILTQCNLNCRHCYINPEQHGRRRLSLETIQSWLRVLVNRAPQANLIFLGGEPTLHPDLAQAVRVARNMGYRSVTIDTNGYLFHDILEKTTPEHVDFFSFSLDGASPATNDPIRGKGAFSACTAGIRAAKARGFRTSLIYTVSRFNLQEITAVPPLLADLGLDRFFIQVIGLRGQSATCPQTQGNEPTLQITRQEWEAFVLPTAQTVAHTGIVVNYPKVYLDPDVSFACAGRVADNYFVFPNGRVYRCPLCEDYPLHSLCFHHDQLVDTPSINEADLFQLDIPEGCVMNRLIQPGNLTYLADGRPAYKIACCLLKEELTATAH
ncbi:MAG: radical SAM protein [Desulfatitalea sp.]|nr:radical SAM protein [Desulfatitalea sp.]NNK00164.1 radical SAM protein [Desulfatitalea sp.]